MNVYKFSGLPTEITPSKLYQLASDGTREAMERLLQIADDYGVNYDFSTKANELVRKIVWTMNRTSEF